MHVVIVFPLCSIWHVLLMKLRHKGSITELRDGMYFSIWAWFESSCRQGIYRAVCSGICFTCVFSSGCSLCAIVWENGWLQYVSSCVSERAVRLRASAASFMSVCHPDPVPGLQWPVAVSSVSLSMMTQAMLRTRRRDCWHVQGCGWGMDMGVPVWGLERT